MQKLIVLLLVFMLILSNSFYIAADELNIVTDSSTENENEEIQYQTLNEDETEEEPINQGGDDNDDSEEISEEPVDQDTENNEEPEEPVDQGVENNEEPEEPEEPVNQDTDNNQEPEEPIDQETENDSETQENINPYMNITSLNVVNRITYGWDLRPDIKIEQFDNNTVVTAKLLSERLIEQNKLSLEVKAEVQEETNINSINAELGLTVEDIFVKIKDLEVNDFLLTHENGKTLVEFNAVTDLDFENSHLVLRLIVIKESDESNEVVLTALQNFELNKEPVAVSSEVIMDTNLLEVIGEIGVADVTEDDWLVTEEMLIADKFEKEVKIAYVNLQETLDLDFLIKIISKDNEILCEMEVNKIIESATQNMENIIIQPEPKVEEMSINSFNVSRSKIYDWRINSEIYTEQKENYYESTVMLSADRYKETNQLIMTIGSEIPQEIVVDSVDVELFNAVGDEVHLNKKISDCQFSQESKDGKTYLTLDANLDIINIDLNQFTLKILAKVSNDYEIVTYVASQEFLLPEEFNTVSKEAYMETNILEVIKDAGTVNVSEDDWLITEESLNSNGIFEKEVKIVFIEEIDTKQFDINVLLVGEGDSELDSETISIILQSAELFCNIWSGEVCQVVGSWLPAVKDDFYLDRKSVPIKFWLKDELAVPIVLKIFETDLDESGNLILLDSVYEMSEDEFRTGIKGKRAKMCGGNLLGEYYTFKLKGKNMSLEGGKTYALAILSGEKILAFDEKTPAILTFTVLEDGTIAKGNKQIKLQRCDSSRYPKSGRNSWRK